MIRINNYNNYFSKNKEGQKTHFTGLVTYNLTSPPTHPWHTIQWTLPPTLLVFQHWTWQTFNLTRPTNHPWHTTQWTLPPTLQVLQSSTCQALSTTLNILHNGLSHKPYKPYNILHDKHSQLPLIYYTMDSPTQYSTRKTLSTTLDILHNWLSHQPYKYDKHSQLSWHTTQLTLPPTLQILQHWT